MTDPDYEPKRKPVTGEPEITVIGNNGQKNQPERYSSLILKNFQESPLWQFIDFKDLSGNEPLQFIHSKEFSGKSKRPRAAAYISPYSYSNSYSSDSPKFKCMVWEIFLWIIGSAFQIGRTRMVGAS